MTQESTTQDRPRPTGAWWSTWAVGMVALSLAMALWVLGEALLRG